ncbi:MAG TPA: hypothetical protein VM802_23045 [Chitinophaga sp.]|uniref:hypothetical protein n=1 Tax=Chitinophaga sp. TaxID=1869181 RepID=UPI002CA7B29F|nr:hypothetical protein [Chitinophaga sp.]HVI47768.1 hypothetical protein [Chitinophaga sp.]
MTTAAKMMCGVILITVPTIEYGGYFLLTVLSGRRDNMQLTPFQKSMFRAGHAHAGVLVILSLVVQLLADESWLSPSITWFVRIAVPLSAILVSGGFFAAAIGEQRQKPSGLIIILYTGVLLLAAAMITLGVGLL